MVGRSRSRGGTSPVGALPALEGGQPVQDHILLSTLACALSLLLLLLLLVLLLLLIMLLGRAETYLAFYACAQHLRQWG